MEVDEDQMEEQEILRIAADIRRGKDMEPSRYRKLLTKYCNSIAGKTLLLDEVLRIFEENRFLPSETYNFMFQIITDPDEDKIVRLHACDRAPLLCVHKDLIDDVVTALSEIIVLETEESTIAKKSLRKIVKEHMTKAFSAFPHIIQNIESVKGKLILLQFFDEELRKYGTVAEKMKKIVQNIFIKMLENAEVGNFDEIEELFTVAVQTSFFDSALSKQQLSAVLWHNNNKFNKISPAPYFEELSKGQDSMSKIERAYELIVAISNWINEPNVTAWNGLMSFINLFLTDPPSNLTIDMFSSNILKKLCYLSQRKRNDNSFRFIDPLDYKNIIDIKFGLLFRAIKPLLDKMCYKRHNEELEDKMEKFLLLVYDLLPPARSLSFFLEERPEWETEAQDLLQQLKRCTERLKIDLNKKDCPGRKDKAEMLRRQLNIGVLLMAFLNETPTRSCLVTPSWLRMWRTPRIAPNSVSSSSPSSNVNTTARKRRSNDDRGQKRKRSHPPTKRPRTHSANQNLVIYNSFHRN